MQPGQRVDVIRRVATRLGSEDDWTIIDLVLEQFGFPIRWEWNGTKDAYVIDCLKQGDDDNLSAIDQYLMGHPRPSDEPWEGEGFRLFLTHLAKRKQIAHTLKSHLRYFGVDAFVAHDDIQAGKEWQVVIESALRSCDALAGLLHDGFRKSDWCDQEVGIALGRGIPVVPIQYDLLPYGFFGSVQAVNNAVDLQPKDLARGLVLILLKDKRTAGRLTEAIVNGLIDATSFKQANQLSQILDEEASLVSRDQVERLRNAEKENRQLQEAFSFDRHISAIETRIDATHGLDEEPPF
ncbi:toll/interleukin-1 receptor domain-containing protein [Candidatus Poriferisodalis sp.]|uniref:toll/interleukin-1 receptor domain-containing protein n=1 Tax=Candidatus Poriferisodalis sp. TaxID=3101277 RepID=UPI003AF48199